jgi:hypothetical protein
MSQSSANREMQPIRKKIVQKDIEKNERMIQQSPEHQLKECYQLRRLTQRRHERLGAGVLWTLIQEAEQGDSLSLSLSYKPFALGR